MSETTATPLSCAITLIIGQGRSGTNMLLGFLDLSSTTHCRNEPNALPGCAFAELERHKFHVDDPADLAARFDDVVRRSAGAVGVRDAPIPAEKSWIRPSARRSRLLALLQRHRLRNLAGLLLPALRGNEVALPERLIDRAALDRAHQVFKLNAACGIAGFALEHRPRVKVLHIVRHPGGFAKSWRSRWLETRDRAEVARLNVERLEDVRRHDPKFELPAGDLSRLEPLETELLFWRWCNERMLACGDHDPRYALLSYEEVTAHPLEQCRRVYEFCGLPWSEAIAAGIARNTERSAEIAGAWRTALDAKEIAIVRRVVAGSGLLERLGCSWGEV